MAASAEGHWNHSDARKRVERSQESTANAHIAGEVASFRARAEIQVQFPSVPSIRRENSGNFTFAKI